MPEQPTIQLTDSINNFMSLSDIVTLIFYVAAAIYVIYSVILHYHWTQYGTNKKVTWITLALYGLTTVPLLLFMAALTFSI